MKKIFFLLAFMLSTIAVSELQAQKKVSIECFSCEKLSPEDCDYCNSKSVTNEYLDGMVVRYDNAKPIIIRKPFEVWTKGRTIYVKDYKGTTASIPVRKTVYNTTKKALQAIFDCSCSTGLEGECQPLVEQTGGIYTFTNPDCSQITLDNSISVVFTVNAGPTAAVTDDAWGNADVMNGETFHFTSADGTIMTTVTEGSAVIDQTVAISQQAGNGISVAVDGIYSDENTDNQNLSDATLTGTNLQIDIEDGASVNVDLAALQDGTGTDDQDLTGATLTGTNLQIDIEDGASTSVDLSALQDGTGTDDQDLTGATLTGTILQIDIEDGASTSVDLAGLQDGTGSDDQNLTGATLTGTDLQIDIEDGTSTTADLSELKDTSLCLTYINDPGHGLTYTELAAVYYIGGSYTYTLGPGGDTLAPVGLLREVIDVNNFVLIRCGFTETTYSDEFYYYTDAGIATSPNQYAETPIFIAHDGVASVNVDFAYIIPEDICVEEPSTSFLIDIASGLNGPSKDFSNININGVNVTLIDLLNASSSGLGLLNLVGNSAATSQETFNSGYIEFTMASDPAIHPLSNPAATFGISEQDYSSARFTADYELYLSRDGIVQVREGGNVVFTSGVNVYAQNSVFRIELNGMDVIYSIDGTAIYTSVSVLTIPNCVPLQEWANTQDSINNRVIAVEKIAHTDQFTVPNVAESLEYFIVPASLSGSTVEVLFSSVTPQQSNIHMQVSLTIQDALGTITQDVGQVEIGNSTRLRKSNPTVILSEGDLIWIACDRLADITSGLGLAATLTFTKP